MRRSLRPIGVTAIVLMALLSFATPAVADPVHDSQWQLSSLNVAEAHKYSQGEGVVVGVVDTGVDAGHPDLAGSVLPGVGLTASGGDGRQDLDGHGTAMAGFIAAHGQAIGIAPKAKILPARALDVRFGLSFASGVGWAIDHGARVLCLAYTSQENEVDRRDVQRAIAMDVIVIAGVGNTDQVGGGPYPLEYPGVVGAAGLDRNGNHAAISVTTPYATLAAPAVDVGSTDTLHGGGTGYALWSGTSDSTAIIAGAAALVRARFPQLSAVEVIHRLTATADDKGPPGRDDQYGYGEINLVKALTADVPPLTSSASAGPTEAIPTPPSSSPGNTGLIVAIAGVVILALAGAALIATGVIRSRTTR
jgi:subtilisin family serine protease